MENKRKQLIKFLFILPALCLLVSTIYFTAWLDEDAFITLRVVDNFLHGQGLRWNINERVLTVTHPLWLLLVAIVVAAADAPYLSILSISGLLSFLSVLVVSRGIFRRNPAALGAWTLILCCSKSWVDYASSGLENPLEYFLTALLLTHLHKGSKSLQDYRAVGVLGGLLVLTRFDLAVFLLPLWCFSIVQQGKEYYWRKAGRWRLTNLFGLTLCTVLIWTIFSFFYFGSLLPNPMLAKIDFFGVYDDKLNTGLWHMFLWIKWDYVSPMLIALASLASLLHGHKQFRMLIWGALLYLVVFLFSGGDYQIGRAMSLPVFTSTAFLVHSLSNRLTILVPLTILITSIGLFHPRAPWSEEYGNVYSSLSPFGSVPGIAAHQFNDERLFMFPATGYRLGGERINWGPLLESYRQSDCSELTTARVELVYGVGSRGWFACREEILIDGNALTDGFLSLLPPVKRPFVPGHSERAIPAGYVESVVSGQNLLLDPQLRRFYDEYRLVSSGRLWSLERLMLLPKFAVFSLYPPIRESFYR